MTPNELNNPLSKEEAMRLLTLWKKCAMCNGEAERRYQEVLDTGILGGCYDEHDNYLCDEHYEELSSATLVIIRAPDGLVLDTYINTEEL